MEDFTSRIILVVTIDNYQINNNTELQIQNIRLSYIWKPDIFYVQYSLLKDFIKFMFGARV